MEENMEYKLCVPCLLGLEGPIADELRRLDMKDVAAENRYRYSLVSLPQMGMLLVSQYRSFLEK